MPVLVLRSGSSCADGQCTPARYELPFNYRHINIIIIMAVAIAIAAIIIIIISLSPYCAVYDVAPSPCWHFINLISLLSRSLTYAPGTNYLIQTFITFPCVNAFIILVLILNFFSSFHRILRSIRRSSVPPMAFHQILFHYDPGS